MEPYCNNCGIKGHIYRHCKLPVLSYGIICFRDDDKILMIQRKDSISYIEFLRGKYSINNESYIYKLLNNCSISERKLLQSLSFDDLWSRLWFMGNTIKNQTDRMIKEYNLSKQSFEQLQKDNTLHTLIERCTTEYNTPEWEFPKGRRSHKETNLQCSIREFEEETDIHTDEYILLENIYPLSEEYTGSNRVRYKHIYYYALYNGSRELSINKDKYEQFSEIGDIQWLSIPECISKIRDGYPTKLDIIHKLDNFIKNWKRDLILK